MLKVSIIISSKENNPFIMHGILRKNVLRRFSKVLQKARKVNHIVNTLNLGMWICLWRNKNFLDVIIHMHIYIFWWIKILQILFQKSATCDRYPYCTIWFVQENDGWSNIAKLLLYGVACCKLYQLSKKMEFQFPKIRQT